MYPKLMIGGALLAGLLAVAPSVDAAGVVVVRPFYYHPHYYAYYGPAFGWWYPGPGPIYIPGRTGELKIDTKDKDALVYIDGGYLGPAGKTKKFDLRTGVHQLELRDADGKVLFHEKVTIAPDRTTKVDAMGVVG
jgi:PEGA domain